MPWQSWIELAIPLGVLMGVAGIRPVASLLATVAYAVAAYFGWIASVSWLVGWVIIWDFIGGNMVGVTQIWPPFWILLITIAGGMAGASGKRTGHRKRAKGQSGDE